ncbi:hypothetical protein D3C72_1304940 [compost metagenome]
MPSAIEPTLYPAQLIAAKNNIGSTTNIAPITYSITCAVTVPSISPDVGSDNSTLLEAETWLYKVSSMLESTQRASSHQKLSMCKVNSANVTVMTVFS